MIILKRKHQKQMAILNRKCVKQDKSEKDKCEKEKAENGNLKKDNVQEDI